MAEEGIAKYQTEHLFLLIGKNPLPNYVAARLLGIKNKTRFYLIYSKGTKPYEGNLKTFLQAEFGKDCVEDLEIDESDPTSITKKIESYSECINSGNVGLNYTGGTKAMAIHSYLAIEKLCSCKNLTPYFSYLTRELELRFDRLPGRPFKLSNPNDPSDGKYFKQASIGLIPLLDLHGYKPREADRSQNEDVATFKNPRCKPQLIEIATCLFDIFNDDSKRGEWKSVVNNLGKSSVALPNSLLDLKAALNAQYLLNNSDELDIANHMKGGFARKDKYIKWLQGNWFEDYILQIALDAPPSINLHDCGASIEPAVPGKGNEHKPLFELDVVALRGYQLFAVSCTLKEDKRDCKLKLLEVFVRAKQLGGDEARIALVCRYENTSELQGEIEQSWDVGKKQVKVFGKKEWPNLKKLLESWFNGKA